jgi:hypothetical protein
MSYNITAFKIKKLKNFKLPVIPDETECEFCEFAISKNEIIHIEISGECSGYFYFNKFLDLLEKSTGELHAIIVFEGGDTIINLSVIDGKIESTEI